MAFNKGPAVFTPGTNPPISVAWQQAFNQLLFLFVGKAVYKLSVTWVEIFLILALSLLIEHALLWVQGKGQRRISSAALSTGFNLAFMLGATWFGVYAFALCFALLQKNLVKKLTGAQFLNPSNAGITAAFLVFPAYTFSTVLDWGQTGWFALLIALLGTALLLRLRLLLVPLVFLSSHVLFELTFQTHNLNEIWRQLNTAGFLLFAFFMVSEPRSLPGSKRYRVLFAAMTAVLYGLLQLALGEKEVNLFLALFLSGFSVPVFRRFESVEKTEVDYKPVGFFSDGMVLVLVVVYFSPWNVLRNKVQAYRRWLDASSASVRSQILAPGQDKPVPPLSVTPDKTWPAADPEWFLASWKKTSVISRPLNAAPRGVRNFEHQSEALPPYSRALDPKWFGFDTSFAAAMAAGDVNHDAYPDLVLAKIGHPLQILINDQKGRFHDFAPDVFPGGTPENVELAALADINNDTYLDLLIFYSPSTGGRPGEMYLFDAATRSFRLNPNFTFGLGKKMSGGISMADVNGDGRLDFYISFGMDWTRSDGYSYIRGYRDEFYVSEGASWRESIGAFFDGPLANDALVGMTALFTDFDQNGSIDFLLGNDFEDPSLAYLGKRGRFSLAPARMLENNVLESMSYFPADFDNDGQFELWENGVTQKLAVGRQALAKEFRSGAGRSLQNREFDKLEKQAARGAFQCAEFTHPVVSVFCADQIAAAMARAGDRIETCKRIQSAFFRSRCETELASLSGDTELPAPSEFNYDVERFPKQIKENALLRFDGKRYVNVIKGNLDAEFTGFSWAAFPFDIDNDGFLDIYVGNGHVFRSHDANVLLMNQADKGAIAFENQAAAFGVDFEDETRGLVVADFDLDGDGDLAVNNYLSDSAYYENLSQGSSIEIDLRSHSGNYYGLGSTLRLSIGSWRQTRQVMLGGIWNTSQPLTQHFGFPEGSEVGALEVRWPNGKLSFHKGLRANHRYVIYE